MYESEALVDRSILFNVRRTDCIYRFAEKNAVCFLRIEYSVRSKSYFPLDDHVHKTWQNDAPLVAKIYTDTNTKSLLGSGLV